MDGRPGAAVSAAAWAASQAGAARRTSGMAGMPTADGAAVPVGIQTTPAAASDSQQKSPRLADPTAGLARLASEAGGFKPAMKSRLRGRAAAGSKDVL